MSFPPTERTIQRCIVDTLRVRYPTALVHHSPNQANDFKRVNAMRADGTLPGWPDLTVLLPNGRSIHLEVKSQYGRLSANQRGIIENMERLGHRVVVVKSVRAAMDAVDEAAK